MGDNIPPISNEEAAKLCKKSDDSTKVIIIFLQQLAKINNLSL